MKTSNINIGADLGKPSILTDESAKGQLITAEALASISKEDQAANLLIEANALIKKAADILEG